MVDIVRLLGLAGLAAGGTVIAREVAREGGSDLNLESLFGGGGGSDRDGGGSIPTEAGSVRLQIPLTPNLEDLKNARASGEAQPVEFQKGLHGQKVARWTKDQLGFPDESRWNPNIVTTGDVPFDKMEIQLGNLNVPGRPLTADPRGQIINVSVGGIPTNSPTPRLRDVRVMDPVGRVWKGTQGGETFRNAVRPAEDFFKRRLRVKGFLTRECNKGVPCPTVEGQLLLSNELPFPRRGRFCFLPGTYEFELILEIVGENVFQVVRAVAEAPGETGVDVGSTAIVIGDKRRMAFFDQCSGEFIRPVNNGKDWEIVAGKMPDVEDTLPVPVRRDAEQELPPVSLISAILETGAIRPDQLAENLLGIMSGAFGGTAFSLSLSAQDTAALNRYGVLQEAKNRIVNQARALVDKGQLSPGTLDEIQTAIENGELGKAQRLMDQVT